MNTLPFTLFSFTLRFPFGGNGHYINYHGTLFLWALQTNILRWSLQTTQSQPIKMSNNWVRAKAVSLHINFYRVRACVCIVYAVLLHDESSDFIDFVSLITQNLTRIRTFTIHRWHKNKNRKNTHKPFHFYSILVEFEWSYHFVYPLRCKDSTNSHQYYMNEWHFIIYNVSVRLAIESATIMASCTHVQQIHYSVYIFVFFFFFFLIWYQFLCLHINSSSLFSFSDSMWIWILSILKKRRFRMLLSRANYSEMP